MTVPDAGGMPAGGATVDLHAHSTASDGAFPPAEVVRRAHAAGLAAVALTDHDTLAGVPEAVATGVELGLRVVPGAELSVTDGEREWHLLALHVADVAGLDARLAEYRAARLTRARDIVERLVTHGIAISYDDVLDAAGGGAVGRPHVARALVQAGHVRDHREAFDRWLAAGRPAFVEKRLIAMADACRFIHAAGGLAVLAHPGGDGRRALIAPLVEAGLDGLEVRHPSHLPEDERRLTSLAAEFGLVRSGGSDWHGALEGSRVLDALRVPHEWLAEQDARVAARTNG